MHCGTTVDKFLRTNLEWLSKASNWNKFNAIASMGVVYVPLLLLRVGCVPLIVASSTIDGV